MERDPDSAPGREYRPTCTNHCAACGRHFHSVDAFDAHRAGLWESRVCLDPACDDRRQHVGGRGEQLIRVPFLSQLGRCRLSGRVPVEGVAIWSLAPTSQERERLSLLRQERLEGIDADRPM